MSHKSKGKGKEDDTNHDDELKSISKSKAPAVMGSKERTTTRLKAPMMTNATMNHWNSMDFKVA